MSAPSLRSVSRVSSLLRANPPPLPQTIPVCLPLRLTADLQSGNDFSCSIQKPAYRYCQLYPGCHNNRNQVAVVALLMQQTVTPHFRHHLIRFRDVCHWFTLFNSYTHTCESNLSLFRIVHHLNCFRFTQHTVVCKLRLNIVCRRPIPLLLIMIPNSFRSTSAFVLSSVKVFHLLYSILKELF